jgi:hypothetical protein
MLALVQALLPASPNAGGPAAGSAVSADEHLDRVLAALLRTDRDADAQALFQVRAVLMRLSRGSMPTRINITPHGRLLTQTLSARSLPASSPVS